MEDKNDISETLRELAQTYNMSVLSILADRVDDETLLLPKDSDGNPWHVGDKCLVIKSYCSYNFRENIWQYDEGVIHKIAYRDDHADGYVSMYHGSEFRAQVQFDNGIGEYPMYLVVRPGTEDCPLDSDGNPWHIGDECFYQGNKSNTRIDNFEWHHDGVYVVCKHYDAEWGRWCDIARPICNIQRPADA